MSRYVDVSAVLLAGGQSRRMGVDKRFLQVGGQSLFSRAMDVLEEVFETVLVSVAQPIPELPVRGHRVVEDLIAGSATLGGLYTALQSAHTEWVFAVACDMPLLNARLVRTLVDRRNEYDYVMPMIAAGPQPMHACYRRSCLGVLERRIKNRLLQLSGILDERSLKGCVIPESELIPFDPNLLSFLNINTPADLELIRKFLEHKTP